MNIKELRELIAQYDRAKIERSRFGQADAPADVTQALMDAEAALDKLLDDLDDDDSAVSFLRLLCDFDRRLETLEASRLLGAAVATEVAGGRSGDAAGH